MATVKTMVNFHSTATTNTAEITINVPDSNTYPELEERLFDASTLEIWTGSGGSGTQLTVGVDYIVEDISEYAQLKTGLSIYTKIKITNASYHDTNLYIPINTLNQYGDVVRAEDINDLASDIDTNTSNISSNDSDISTNAGNISTNTSNISTNAGNISTNVTNISNITPYYDTAANLTSSNPVLNAGQLGIESDTGLIKRGDGTTAWTSLAYNIIGGDNHYINASGNVIFGSDLSLYDGTTDQDRQITLASDASILWDESEDEVVINKNVNVSSISISGGTVPILNYYEASTGTGYSITEDDVFQEIDAVYGGISNGQIRPVNGFSVFYSGAGSLYFFDGSAQAWAVQGSNQFVPNITAIEKVSSTIYYIYGYTPNNNLNDYIGRMTITSGSSNLCANCIYLIGY